MSQTGKQDLDEALTSPVALQEQLGILLQRQRVRTWIHAASAALFFTGLLVVLWLSLETPSKGEKAAGAAIAFGLLGIFQGVLAISSRKQAHALQNCREILKSKAEEQDHGVPSPRFDFLIHEASTDGWITGRNCRDDLPLGLVFTALYRRDYPEGRSGDELPSPGMVFVRDVSLRLDTVELYGKNMDFVAHGYTALLGISGSDILTVSDLVSSAPDHTHYSLCAFGD